jgi:hypothetical protein
MPQDAGIICSEPEAFPDKGGTKGAAGDAREEIREGLCPQAKVRKVKNNAVNKRRLMPPAPFSAESQAVGREFCWPGWN